LRTWSTGTSSDPASGQKVCGLGEAEGPRPKRPTAPRAGCTKCFHNTTCAAGSALAVVDRPAGGCPTGRPPCAASQYLTSGCGGRVVERFFARARTPALCRRPHRIQSPSRETAASLEGKGEKEEKGERRKPAQVIANCRTGFKSAPLWSRKLTQRT